MEILHRLEILLFLGNTRRMNPIQTYIFVPSRLTHCVAIASAINRISFYYTKFGFKSTFPNVLEECWFYWRWTNYYYIA